MNRWHVTDQKKTGSVGKSTVTVGRFTYGYNGLSIKQWGEGASLTIGSFCSIAGGVTVLLGGNHRVDWCTTFPFGFIYQDELGEAANAGHPGTRGDVIIGSDVWIGYGVTILSGVSVGDGAVLAATSTVTRDVRPYEIVGGNPAKPLKYRFDHHVISLLLELKWWELPLEAIKEIKRDLSSPPSAPILEALVKRYR